jgi:penicillin-insensitive murein endopeptidase
MVPLTALADDPLVESAVERNTATDSPRVVWGRFQTPLEARAEAIGGYSNGCLLGAAQLPAEGPGYQTVELQRNRRYGHSQTVGFLRELGEQVASAGLGRVLIGDIAQPRGGPASLHGSHQTGLDVDVWLRLEPSRLTRRQRQNMNHPSMVTDETPRRVHPERWSAGLAELVRLAASDARVTRILLDAAIKRDLCDRAWDDRSWLRKVRHWPGHDDHMHVRLACPRGSPECIDQAPPPPGEGCGPELDAILNPPPAPDGPVSRPRDRPPPPMPDRCRAVVEDALQADTALATMPPATPN